MKKHTSNHQHHRLPVRPKVFFQLATGLLLTSLLMTASVAWAKYRPPTGDPPSGSLVSNGSRSGDQPDIPLTALAPSHHVGQTTTTTPTLAWFVPATDPYRISLSLYNVHRDGGLKLLLQLDYVASASGIVRFPLPKDQATLKPDQRYLWRVSLAFDPDSTTYDQSFESELDIKEPSAALTAALTAAPTPLEKAEIYAEAGYWYDALREALSVSDHSDYSDAAKITRSLLQELAQTEGDIHRQSLAQIAETLSIGGTATQPQSGE